MNAPRVVHVSPSYFADASTIGGAERYVTELARAMASLAPTSLVSFGPEERRATEDQLAVHTLRPAFLIRGRTSNPFSLRFLRTVLQHDVVHCHQFNTFVANAVQVAGWLWRRRVFLMDHAGGGINLNALINLVRRCDGFTYQSSFAADYVRERYHVPEERLHWIGAGVDPLRFRPARAPATFSALFVGRLMPHKGVDVLLQACEEGLPVTVVGRPHDPPYHDRLRQLAAGKPARFVLDADDQRLVEELRACSVLVLPSLPLSRRPELFGLVLLEAMATGRPVVVSDAGAMAEFVHDGEDGFVVPAGDWQALRATLHRLRADGVLAAQMGQRARVRVEEGCTWLHVARRCLEAYALAR